jgi:hypothetical protein
MRGASQQSVDHPVTYVIRVQGRIAERWFGWFEGMSIVAETGPCGTTITTLTGTFVDQAALFGLLRRLYNLRLSLLSVNRVEWQGMGGNDEN